ncbi:TatD family hydrolase [Schaalia sp. lx-260]|uniref:TatD family hydrolase n=1 Tax=Schaalia sp. lx-260 TaxID=2899082 RepID=UPI001E3FD3D8|nr:TatD family hydrolase [Schaalia sp. lx-260]
MGKKKTRTWPDTPLPLAGPVMDNHTHLPVHELQIPRADGVRISVEEQIMRARAVGVTYQITSACELPECEPAFRLARTYPSVRVAVAIHPNEAALHGGYAQASPDGLQPEIKEHHIALDDALSQIENYARDPMVVAVGETGLDYFRTAQEGREAQVRSFEAHVEIAHALSLPLQIHDRDAHADTLSLLRRCAHAGQPIVFHCFSGDASMAQVLAENGWYASFAGPLTYPANEDLRKALKALPRNRVLVETDAPYLTPVPHRGSPNASYVMPHTVRYIADLWEASESETCEQLMRNSCDVYGVWDNAV